MNEMITVPDNEPVKGVVMAVCRGVDNFDKISTFQYGFNGLDILVRCRVEMKAKVSKDEKLTSTGCITVDEVFEFRHEHVGREFIFLVWWRPVEKNKSYNKLMDKQDLVHNQTREPCKQTHVFQSEYRVTHSSHGRLLFSSPMPSTDST